MRLRNGDRGPVHGRSLEAAGLVGLCDALAGVHRSQVGDGVGRDHVEAGFCDDQDPGGVDELGSLQLIVLLSLQRLRDLCLKGIRSDLVGGHDGMADSSEYEGEGEAR